MTKYYKGCLKKPVPSSLLCTIHTAWLVSALIARAEPEHEKRPLLLPCCQEAALASYHTSSLWDFCAHPGGADVANVPLGKKENGNSFIQRFREIIYSKRHTPNTGFSSCQVPQRVSYTKRISEKSKPTNREPAPDRWLDCCYSAAQRDCWAREKIKEPFVDACDDTAHVYAHHVTPFTSLSFAAGV